jgi:hypothetical protein
MIYLRELVAGLVSPLVVASRPRFARQLRKFAHTELYTFHDIGTVAARETPAVRAEMERHARDELRHYHLFEDWSARLAPYVGANYGDPEDSGGLDEASVQLQAELEAAPNRRLPRLGDYMTYIFLSESRAVLQFKLTYWLNAWDERCRKQIPLVLADETRHVSYSARHAWREFKKAPWASFVGFWRVLGYILRQDVIDLLKLVSTIGSAVAGGLLYYGIVTPYGWVLRAAGALRRARLRTTPASGRVPLDAAFWDDA